MKAQPIYRLLFASLMVVGLLLVFGSVHQLNQTVDRGNTHHLKAPLFVGMASAASNSAAMDIGTRLDQEAGISAYFKSPDVITLGQVRGLFRTIEAETEDYIIGSVPVANYPETEDVHVYVHKDGWILAYYLAAEPAAKVLDWRKYHDSDRTDFTTKLESAIAVVAGGAGIPFHYSATYYDFRYPDATHLMLIGEWVYGDQYGQADFFDVKLPGNLTYYERSWSFGRWVSDASRCTTGTTINVTWYQLDGATMQTYTNSCPGLAWQTCQGTLTAAQLLPDQFHRTAVHAIGSHAHRYSVYAYGGLALVYQVP